MAHHARAVEDVTYFEWQDTTKRLSPHQKLQTIVDLYVDRYDVYPEFCMLSVEDYAQITAHTTLAHGTVAGLVLLPRPFMKPGSFRLALPEEEE